MEWKWKTGLKEANSLHQNGRLKTVMGEEKPEFDVEMSVSEASGLISELMAKGEQNGHPILRKKINEPRLGMAMKECFRLTAGR